MALALLQAVANVDATGLSLTLLLGALTSAVTAGSVLYVVVRNRKDISPTITDTLGHTYTFISRVYDSTNDVSVSHFYCKNTLSGSNTINVNYNAGDLITFSLMGAMEIGGADKSNPLDGHCGQAQLDPGTATDAVTSGSLTPTENNTMAVGATFQTDGTLLVSHTAGTGFTSQQAVTGIVTNGRLESKLLALKAQVAATFTVDSALADMITVMAIFRGQRKGHTVRVF